MKLHPKLPPQRVEPAFDAIGEIREMVMSTDGTGVAERPEALDAGEWARRRGYPPILGDKAGEAEEIRRQAVLAVRGYRDRCAREMRPVYEDGRVSLECVVAVIAALDTYVTEISRATNADWWIVGGTKCLDEAVQRIARAVGGLDENDVVWVPRLPTRTSGLGMRQERDL